MLQLVTLAAMMTVGGPTETISETSALRFLRLPVAAAGVRPGGIPTRQSLRTMNGRSVYGIFADEWYFGDTAAILSAETHVVGVVVDLTPVVGQKSVGLLASVWAGQGSGGQYGHFELLALGLNSDGTLTRHFNIRIGEWSADRNWKKRKARHVCTGCSSMAIRCEALLVPEVSGDRLSLRVPDGSIHACWGNEDESEDERLVHVGTWCFKSGKLSRCKDSK